MTPNALFDAALQLAGTGWRVSMTEFQGEPKQLGLILEHDGRKVACPECERRCTIYDRVEKRWRHLNFFQYRCELVAQVPRADCPEHGAKLITVSWAAPGSGFTLLFEALVMLLAGQMPVSEVARVVGEEDTRLWRLIQRLVEAAHAAADWSAVRAIAIDETSTRRGRCYATVILDLDKRAVLFLAQGRDSHAVSRFAEELRLHGGDPAQIRWVSMDMLHCYNKGVRENFPQAEIVFERYHLMVMAGEAVDEIRRQMQRAGADLKGSLWALRDALQDIDEAPTEDGPALLEQWCAWARRSRLGASQKLAWTIRQWWTGITNSFDQRITQGAIEAINGIIQLAKRRARGFRNFIYLRTIAYWNTAKLDINLPSLAPT